MSETDIESARAALKKRQAAAIPYSEASDNEALRLRLEKIKAAGTLMPSEAGILDDLNAKAETNQQVIGETGSAYRGFSHDQLAGQRDTMAGVKSWAQGDGYNSGRDESRAIDTAHMEAHPEAFDKGRMAGSAALGAGLGERELHHCELGLFFAIRLTLGQLRNL